MIKDTGTGRKVSLLVALAFLTGGVAAAEVDIDDGDGRIWLDSDSDSRLNADLTCGSGNDALNMTLRQDGDVEETFNSSEVDGYDMSGSSVGEYNLTGRCNASTGFKTAYQTFNVYELVVEEFKPFSTGTSSFVARRGQRIGESSDRKLTGQKQLELKFDVRGDSSNEVLDPEEFDFQVSMQGEGELDLGRHYEVEEAGGDGYTATLFPRVPSGASWYHHSLTVDVMVPEPEAGGEFPVTAESDDYGGSIYLSPVKITSVEPSRDIVVGELDELGFTVKVADGYQRELSDDKFALEVEGRSNDIKALDVVSTEKSNTYDLRLEKIPQAPDGSESFRVWLKFKDREYTEESGYRLFQYNVARKVAFRGTVQNTRRTPILTSFRALSSGSSVRKFSTVSGEYSERFDTGTYDFEVKFRPGGEGSEAKGGLDLQGVELKKGNDGQVKFEYSSQPKSVDVPGVTPVDMMSVTFGYPFKGEGSTAWMRFDPSGVDPTEVSVFECRKWNFFGQNCISGWEKVKDEAVSVVPTLWKVRFPVEPLETKYFEKRKKILMSAYVIGTKSSLGLDGALRLKGTSGGRIGSGKKLTVSGDLVSGGSPVSDADLNVTLREDGDVVKTFTGTSGTDGSFSVSGNVPEEPGNYTLVLRASREPYDSLKKEKPAPIWVYESQGLAVKPETTGNIPIYRGDTSKTTISLENIGDTTLEDVSISTESSDGIKPDHFSFSTKSIGRMEPGESRDIGVKFSVPEDCSGCSSFPQIVVSVTGEGPKGDIERSVRLNMVVEEKDQESQGTEGNSSTVEEASDGGSSPLVGKSFVSAPELGDFNPTGKFLASQSTLNIALGLVMVFMMVLAGAVKNKGGSGSRSGRSGRSPRTVSGGSGSMSRPDFSGQESGGSRGEAETGSDDPEDGSTPPNVCDECGEEFDTESAVDMHREVAH
ncbi:MAG: hypothetical protein ABEJ03_03425 [Candidatus Nanohaloarchaea archaeon]